MDWRKGHQPHDAEYVAKISDPEILMCLEEYCEVAWDVDNALDLSDAAIPAWETINHPRRESAMKDAERAALARLRAVWTPPCDWRFCVTAGSMTTSHQPELPNSRDRSGIGQHGCR